MEYNVGLMDCVNKDKILVKTIIKEIPEELKESGSKAVKAFDLHAQFFHLEFFLRTRDKHFYALEANLRPPGGWSVDMMNIAFDTDLYEAWSRVLINTQELVVPKQNRNFCSFVSRKYRDYREYVHSHEEILETFQDYIMMYKEVPEIFRKVNGDVFYMSRLDTAEDVQYFRNFIEERHEHTDQSNRSSSAE